MQLLYSQIPATGLIPTVRVVVVVEEEEEEEEEEDSRRHKDEVA